MIVESQVKHLSKGLSKEYVKTLPVGTPLKGTYRDGSGFLFKYVCISKTTGDICWTTACVAFDKDNHIDIETSFLGYKTGEAYRLTKFENLIVERMTNEELEKYHDAIKSNRIEPLGASDAEHNKVESLYEADIPLAKLEKRDGVKEIQPKIVIPDTPIIYNPYEVAQTHLTLPKYYTDEEEQKYFKPFCTKVLVCNGDGVWTPAIFGCMSRKMTERGIIQKSYTVVGGNTYTHCIPWKLNKELLGETFTKLY